MSRAFVAEFFDAEAHMATDEVTIKLTCGWDGNGLVCCNGDSVDVKEDGYDCGTCGNVCEFFCEDGECGE